MNTGRGVRRVQPGIVYGPVRSRRFGASLGINISGSGKHCSFDCLYCFRGINDDRPNSIDYRSGLPSADMVMDALNRWLESSSGDFDDLTIAGNAEPTDHPAFPEIVERIIRLRDNLIRRINITVLTNGMGLLPRLNSKYEKVRSALEKIDQPCLKLDSGVPATWRKIARPYRNVAFSEWFKAIQALPGPIIQTMLVKGRIDNTTPKELSHLNECFEILRPKDIQLLTINKAPADPGLYPVERDEIGRIRRYFTKSKRLEGVIQ